MQYNLKMRSWGKAVLLFGSCLRLKLVFYGLKRFSSVILSHSVIHIPRASAWPFTFSDELSSLLSSEIFNI